VPSLLAPIISTVGLAVSARMRPPADRPAAWLSKIDFTIIVAAARHDHDHHNDHEWTSSASNSRHRHDRGDDDRRPTAATSRRVKALGVILVDG
jgi:hypothetical protein